MRVLEMKPACAHKCPDGVHSHALFIHRPSVRHVRAGKLERIRLRYEEAERRQAALTMS